MDQPMNRVNNLVGAEQLVDRRSTLRAVWPLKEPAW